MPEIIQCPSCQRELQVPEDFVGRPVKCPSCGMNFVTSAQAGAPRPIPRVGDPGEFAAPNVALGYGEPPPPSGVSGMVLAPAICLLIVGILAFLVDVVELVMVMNPQMMPAGKGLPPALQEALQEQQQNVGFNTVRSLIFLVLSVVILAGAAQMMRQRSWGLAMAASIIAMLHFQECCCLLGLPIGIWSIVILCRADVRSMFQ